MDVPRLYLLTSAEATLGCSGSGFFWLGCRDESPRRNRIFSSSRSSFFNRGLFPTKQPVGAETASPAAGASATEEVTSAPAAGEAATSAIAATAAEAATVVFCCYDAVAGSGCYEPREEGRIGMPSVRATVARPTSGLRRTNAANYAGSRRLSSHAGLVTLSEVVTNASGSDACAGLPHEANQHGNRR